MEENKIVIYQTEDGVSKLTVNMRDETVWLSLDQMAELFQRDRSVIGKHVRNIFKEGELKKDSVWAKFAYTAADGKDYNVDFYNLDVIISVGYRVKSIRGTQFRIWATSTLKEYITKGYAINEKMLKSKQEQIQTLQSTLNLLTRSIENQIETVDDAQNVAKILDNFAKGLNLLDNFDHKTLDSKGSTEKEAIIIPAIQELLLFMIAI